MKFSVLISIYYKEEVGSFNRAMRSVWDEQTVKPNEVVLVEDGPLTDGLYQAIGEWKERLANTLQVVSLKENVGNILILKYCQLFLKPFRQRHIIRIHHRNQLTTTHLYANILSSTNTNILFKRNNLQGISQPIKLFLSFYY
jgi:hypothetical protein